MHLPLRPECPPSGSAADPRLEKLHSIFLAARRTAFYGWAAVPSLEEVPGQRSLGALLAGFRVVPLAEFLARREEFLVPGAASVFAPRKGVQSVPNGWRARLGFRAEAMEGSAAALLRIADSGDALRRLRGARRVLVNTLLGEPLLSEAMRERLWSAFELPVLERLCSFHGETLASECDAHDGLHLDAQAAVFELIGGELVVTSLAWVHCPVIRLGTGWAGVIAQARCACGDNAPRFLPTAADSRRLRPVGTASQFRSPGLPVNW
ncbi:MAG: hypothetical protein ABSD27_04205 [Bryobacteraceae bacterium]